jgi:hypothetical protein
MAEMLPPVRRLVTENVNGQARIVEDGLAPAIITEASRPGFRITNLWVTKETPVAIDTPDGSVAHKGLLPPKNGSVVRIIDMPPEPKDAAEARRQFLATFNRVYPDGKHTGGEGKHPGMHTTETVDYAIIMEGEVWAIMDEGETLMRAGDVLIQRGTNHAWANRSDKPVRICFVLLDGKFGEKRPA